MIKTRRTRIDRGNCRRKPRGAATLLLTLTLVGMLTMLAGAPAVFAHEPDMAAIAETTTFLDSYRGWDGWTNRFDKLYGIYGKEPAADGKYPVFIYFVGGWLLLNAVHYGDDAQIMVQEMAKRGFVAASVNYDNWPTATCLNLSLSSWSIFNNFRTSAISSVCSREKADCSKGIVLAGLSHGAQIAILGKNFDDRVQAVYGISPGSKERLVGTALCLGEGNRALSSDRLRVISGESDAASTWYVAPDEVRLGLQTLTGLNCGPESYTCLSGNGSGWYMVRDSEVEDGVADHCYIKNNFCVSSSRFDEGWLPPATHEWSLDTNLDWLQRFVTPGP